jgi:hypothetical protein
MRKNISGFYIAITICLTLFAASRAKTGAQPGKVYDPGEVAASCAGNLGLSGAAAMYLAAAFRDSSGHITDGFKDKASLYIAESNNTQLSQNDPIFQQYISCLKSAAAQ